MAFTYNNPNSVASTIDAGTNSQQLQVFHWLKKALIDAKKEAYFSQLADTINMPKHFGKTIKRYQYYPLLDDRNVNDQGIDASGATISNGNLYGSSKDIGTIAAKLPTLTENGGRVNRVGFARTVREGTFQNYGFFYEWTQDAMNFDSDAELRSHLAEELVKGAVEMQEDLLQMDLLSVAGSTVVYSGSAQSAADLDDSNMISWKSLQRLDRLLTDNRTPMQTKIITGTRLVDTKVIAGGRVAYCGPEMVAYLETLVDNFGNPAFTSVEHYAAGTHVMTGEVGAIGKFRIIQVPEMQKWAGVGATASKTDYFSTAGKYDVFPFLVVGDDAFNTIGFQTDGKSAKFSIITKEPGRETADRDDPYGKKGFSSLQFWYGFLVNRPERIGMIKSVLPV